jgi:glycosyltransferase involved in cell wall biosynthesis
MGHAILGYFAVKQHSHLEGKPDLMHCWSSGAMGLAAVLFRRTPKLLTLTLPPAPSDARWLRAITSVAASRSALLPINSTIHREILTRGVPPRSAHVLRPGLDLGQVAPSHRQCLRNQWDVDHDAKIAVLVSDPPAAADAMPAALAIAMAEEASGHRIYLLIHPDSQNRRRAQRDMDHQGKSNRLILDYRTSEPWRVMPGCDVAVAVGPDAGGLSLLWAMCANLPIVGEATYAISENVEDRHSALLAKPGQHTKLAHHLSHILSDPQFAWKLRDTARHEAFSLFSRQQYCRSLATVYEQMVADKPVQVPPPESTGGMRFDGRA